MSGMVLRVSHGLRTLPISVVFVVVVSFIVIVRGIRPLILHMTLIITLLIALIVTLAIAWLVISAPMAVLHWCLLLSAIVAILVVTRSRGHGSEAHVECRVCVAEKKEKKMKLFPCSQAVARQQRS